MNFSLKILIIAIFTAACSIFSAPSKAAPFFGELIVYFDASGNLVGQHMLRCNGVQQSQGNTSAAYYRLERFACANFTQSGYRCTSSGQSFSCQFVRSSPPPFGVVNTDYILPPSLSLEDSCLVAECDLPAPMMLPGLTGPITSP